MADRLDRLGRALASWQSDEPEEAADLAKAKSRLFAPQARPKSKAKRWLTTGVAAVAIGCFAAVVWRMPRSSVSSAAEVTAQTGDWLRAGKGPLAVDFSDGSQVLLSPDTHMRVTRAEGAQVDLALESGRVAVEVVHEAGKRWVLRAGPFAVRVVGTEFGLAFDPVDVQLRVELQRGTVIISGCRFGAGIRIQAGETVEAKCEDEHVQLEHETDTSADVPEPPELPPALEDAPKRQATAVPGAGGTSLPPSWQELLADGQYAAGLEAAKRAGFARQCESASVSDLASLGDAARYLGDTGLATRAYQALRRRFPGHQRAALAAFAMGRIAFDQHRDFAAAARWFATYLREQPGGSLAREALGLQMEALTRSGQQNAARRLAAGYLSAYPAGPHVDLARQLTTSQ